MKFANDNIINTEFGANYIGEFSVGNSCTVTFEGDYSAQVRVIKGGNIILPTPEDGYFYKFTVDNLDFNGKNISNDCTVNVEKILIDEPDDGNNAKSLWEMILELFNKIAEFFRKLFS